VLIIGLMIYFMFKYKRVEGVEPEKSPAHNTILELTWTIIPSLLVVVIFSVGLAGYNDMLNPQPKDEIIKVSGAQWNWTMTYPNGIQSNELHVTVGKPYKLVMSSNDVLHSFFIPVCRAKQDVVPGRYTFIWFDTFETGVSEIFCTEYCGKSHSQMNSKFHVHPKEHVYDEKLSITEQQTFDEWMVVASNPELNKDYKGADGNYDPVKYGAALYQKRGCVSCHSIDGKKNTGPSFKDNWGTEREFMDGSKAIMDENYVSNSILYPGKQIRKGYENKMPSYAGQLKQRDIDAIIAFLKTLAQK
jgi:cytochrome c oxidase subunit 2